MAVLDEVIAGLRLVYHGNGRRSQAHSLGFVEYGFERKALKVEGRYYDDVLMALDLRASAAGTG